MAGSVGSLSVSLGLDAAEFVDGISKADVAAKKLEASAAKLAAGIDKQVASLQRQADIMGMSARQVKLFDLAQRGATAAQLEAADAAIKQAEAYEKGEKIGTAIKVGLVAIAAAAVGAAAAYNELVRSVGDYNSLGDKTGASGEDFASFAIAAASSGTALDAVAAASVKLTANLTGVDDESKAAGAALKAMGLNIADFKSLDPASQLDAISKSLSGFADGPGKTAAAVALLGKSGADMLGFFKDLEETGGRQVILTQKQIDLADDYAKKQDIAAEKLKLYAQAAATEALPAIAELQKEFAKVIASLVSFDKEASGLSANSAVREFAEGAVIALAVVGETIVGIVKALSVLGSAFTTVAGDVKTFFKAAGSVAVGDFKGVTDAFAERNKTVEGFNRKLDDLINYNGTAVSSALRKSFADQKRVLSPDDAFEARRMSSAADRNVPTKQALPFNGPTRGGRSKAPTDDPTKKLLDNSLKSIEAGIKAQQDAFDAMGKASDRLYSENLVGITDYYEKKQSLQNAALLAEVAGYDREIALLQAHQAATSKQTDKADDQGKIDALLDKRKLAEQKSAEATQAATYQQSKAYGDLAKAVGGVNVQVLEMQGHLAEAAAIKFDQSNKSLKDLFTSNGNTDALQQLDTLKQYTVARAAYDQQSQESARVSADLQLAEDRVSIAQQLGTQGELTGLKALGEARQDAVVKLQAIVQAQEAVAAASGNPALIQNAEQARVALEKLEASADPLADKFNNIFETSFGNAFADFITGSKTASEAFQSFAKSVISSLANIAAQEVAKSIFGGSSSGGIGGLLAGLFSSGSGSSGLSSSLFSEVGGATAYSYGLAVGTDYVPRDNFPALLHKGEAVVPAAYNKTANRLGTSDGNLTIVNQTTGRIDKATTMQLSPTERALIIQEAVTQSGNQFADPNSHMSSRFSKAFKAERQR